MELRSAGGSLLAVLLLVGAPAAGRDPVFDSLRGEDRFEDVVAFMERDIRQQRETVE